MSNIFRRSPSGRISSNDLIKSNPIPDEFWESSQGEQHSGIALISGKGSQVGLALKGGRGSVSVSATGVLLAIGIVGMLTIASISGGGSQVAVGKKHGLSLISISANGQLTSSGIKTTGASVQISTNGFIQGVGSKQAFSDSSISGNGSVVAEGYQPESHSGISVISGNGFISSVGSKNAEGTISIYIESESPSVMMGSDGKLLKKISNTFYLKL